MNNARTHTGMYISYRYTQTQGREIVHACKNTHWQRPKTRPSYGKITLHEVTQLWRAHGIKREGTHKQANCRLCSTRRHEQETSLTMMLIDASLAYIMCRFSMRAKHPRNKRRLVQIYRTLVFQLKEENCKKS